MRTDHSGVFESVHRDASSLRYHRHGISFATIVLEGSYTEVRDGVPSAYSKGSIVLHPPSEEHSDYFTSATRCLNVELDETMTPGFVEAAALHLTRCDGTPEARVALSRLRLLLESRGQTQLPVFPAWLQATIEYFGWSTAQPLREAATLAGVHQTHFSREFRRYIRMTPSGFRSRARVRRASELLLSTSTPLARIAQECGFSDQSHLTRAFGAALGLSPAAYRRTFAR
ncbi:MAG TPA: helix-turn-helix domain-containing protein [Candidatus Baltobacteraceae bacterium]|nr:helix-turn-helix domain-containing protein [Candidatus Baltobacteraceae bacterium]